MFIFRLLLCCLFTSMAFARPMVVSTNTIIADVVRTIGGEEIEPVCLLPAGADPHSYDPTPADVRRLAKADLVIINGLGFETWIDKLIKNSGYRGPLVVASTGITPIHVEEPGHEGHDHGEDDPHVWHDVKNVRRFAETIRDALAQLDATHADTFRARTATYLAELDALDTYARAQLAIIPADQRKLVTSHDALRYLGQAYGLTIVPIAGLRPDQEPSAKQLATIVKFIRQQQVRAVFIESTSNPKIPGLIAREAGVTICTELYTDSLGPIGSPGATYTGMMRANIDAIVSALK